MSYKHFHYRLLNLIYGTLFFRYLACVRVYVHNRFDRFFVEILLVNSVKLCWGVCHAY